jgi:concentrative nucleoside transporter, CNT family
MLSISVIANAQSETLPPENSEPASTQITTESNESQADSVSMEGTTADDIINQEKSTGAEVLSVDRKAFSFSFMVIVRGLFGMLILIAIAWVFSVNRKAVSWKLVGIGLGIQILLAIGILQVPAIQYFFELGGKVFVKILDFSKAGTEFFLRVFLMLKATVSCLPSRYCQP